VVSGHKSREDHAAVCILSDGRAVAWRRLNDAVVVEELLPGRRRMELKGGRLQYCEGLVKIRNALETPGFHAVLPATNVYVQEK